MGCASLSSIGTKNALGNLQGTTARRGHGS
jgi:hypothetical protein